MTRTLAGRLFAILLAATVAIQVLSFGGVLAISAKTMRAQMYDFLAADLAFFHRFLAATPPGERAQWMGALQRGYYELEIVPPDEVANSAAEFVYPALLDRVNHALQGRAQARLRTWHSGLLTLVVPLDGQHTLLVHLPDRPPLSPPPWPVILAYLALVTLGVLLVVVYAVRLATRPLQRFTEAAHTLAHDLDAPPLPEAGTTEVRQASHAFNAMQAALQKTLRERTRILASISHDLKTPLTRLRLRLAALPAGPERHAAEQDIDAMEALIQEGLDYARSEQVQEARVPIDLNAMLDTLVEQAEDMGHRVAMRGRMAGPVTCAPRATQRALQNLLDNALKYGRDVTVELAQDESQALVRILDRGPGIAAEQLERVFEPFYRVESSRNRATGGTGLGLTIARNLLHAQGARLQLRNREGGGLEALVALSQGPG